MALSFPYIEHPKQPLIWIIISFQEIDASFLVPRHTTITNVLFTVDSLEAYYLLAHIICSFAFPWYFTSVELPNVHIDDFINFSCFINKPRFYILSIKLLFFLCLSFVLFYEEKFYDSKLVNLYEVYFSSRFKLRKS